MSCLACCALSSICSGASCVFNCCGKTASLHHGVRVVYFVFFLATALLAWVASAFGNDIVSSIYHQAASSSNFWPSSAYKITLAFAVFHLLLGVASIGVKDAHSPRGALHNGWWGPKFIIWAGLVVGFLFLPTDGFLVVYPWISLVGSVIFTLIQLFMLVDFAHTWNESWVAKYHETNNKNWFWLLLSVTILFLLLSLAMTVLMFVFLRWGGDTCPYNGLNLGFTAAGLISVVICCVLSVFPSIQAHNPRASLLTSSIVCLYATYLVGSALLSEPSDIGCSYQQSSHNEAFKIASVVAGALITFVAVAFSSMRAGSHAGSAPSTERTALVNNADGTADEKDDDEEAKHESATERELAKKDRELLNLDEHNERGFEPVAYNYTWFHAVMGLGSMYIGSLLSNWGSGVASWVVDKSMVSVYLKAISAFVVCLLYIWTLVAPIVLPNRDFGFDQ